MKSSGFLLLQQNDFLSNYVGSFQELRAAEELFDVTIACEDETVEAHKVVMSACSPFFRHVFSKTKQNHPFVYLKGVMYKDLVALLDYVYTGEAQVPAEDVDRFIEAGKEMKIKGLIEEDVEENKEVEQEVEPQESKVETMEASNSSDLAELSFLNESAEMDESFNVEVKQEKEGKGHEELITEINNRIEKVEDTEEGKMWKCTECGKMLKKRNKLALHIETHLEGFSHACAHCDKILKTRGALSAHMSITHRAAK